MSVVITVDGDKRNWNYNLQSSGTTLTGTTTWSGLVTEMLLGGAEQSYSRGEAMRVDSVGMLQRSDADAASTMPVFCLLCEDGDTGDWVKVLLQGFFRLETWSWATTGGLLYASTSSGELTQTAPSGGGDQVQALGIALSNEVIYFKPDYTLVEI